MTRVSGDKLILGPDGSGQLSVSKAQIESIGVGGDSAPSGANGGMYYIDSDDNAYLMPVFDNNVSSFSPIYLELNSATDVTVTGENFTSLTTFDFGAGVTVNSTTVSSPTQAVVNVTATTSGSKTVQANVKGDAEGSTAIIKAYTAVLVPGDGTTTWDNEVGATGGNGTIVRSGGTGSAWDTGATFGSVANGEDFVLQFTINSDGIQKAMVGFVTSYVDENWTNTQYGLYFGATAVSVTSIENGLVGASLPIYAAGDVFEIRRVGTAVTAYQNDALIHTFADSSAEAELIAEINFNSMTDSITDISLRYI